MLKQSGRRSMFDTGWAPRSLAPSSWTSSSHAWDDTVTAKVQDHTWKTMVWKWMSNTMHILSISDGRSWYVIVCDGMWWYGMVCDVWWYMWVWQCLTCAMIYRLSEEWCGHIHATCVINDFWYFWIHAQTMFNISQITEPWFSSWKCHACVDHVKQLEILAYWMYWKCLSKCSPTFPMLSQCS